MVTNRYASGKLDFLAWTYHFDSSLGTTTSVPAGSSWCSNTAPASEVRGEVTYWLDTGDYYGSYIGMIYYAV
jgi:hypothetical protein